MRNRKPTSATPEFILAAEEADYEAQLIDRIRMRDLQAFETLYEDYRPRLGHFLSNIVNRPQTVEEVFNDTMLVVWEKLNDFAGQSKLSTWIFAIAYRKGIKARQRQDLPVESDLDERPIWGEDDPERQLGNDRLRQVLMRALDTLSADHRTVIDLAYFHEMHYREIADVMDCPVDTVKTRMFHARRKLKTILGGNVLDWF